METTVFLVIIAGLLEMSHAQFGSFSATQNCVGSSCNQNNFGRKRRQILEDILLEVEKEEVSRVERDAQVVAAQNCADSNCNQNNVAARAPASAPVPQPVPLSIPVPQLVPLEIPVPSVVAPILPPGFPFTSGFP